MTKQEAVHQFYLVFLRLIDTLKYNKKHNKHNDYSCFSATCPEPLKQYNKTHKKEMCDFEKNSQCLIIWKDGRKHCDCNLLLKKKLEPAIRSHDFDQAIKIAKKITNLRSIIDD